MSTHNENKYPVSVSNKVIIILLLYLAIGGFGSMFSRMHYYTQVDVTIVSEDN